MTKAEVIKKLSSIPKPPKELQDEFINELTSMLKLYCKKADGSLNLEVAAMVGPTFIHHGCRLLFLMAEEVDNKSTDAHEIVFDSAQTAVTRAFTEFTVKAMLDEVINLTKGTP